MRRNRNCCAATAMQLFTATWLSYCRLLPRAQGLRGRQASAEGPVRLRRRPDRLAVDHLSHHLHAGPVRRRVARQAHGEPARARLGHVRRRRLQHRARAGWSIRTSRACSCGCASPWASTASRRPRAGRTTSRCSQTGRAAPSAERCSASGAAATRSASIAGKALAGFLLGWLGMAWSFYGSSIVLLAFTAVLRPLRARAPAVGRPVARRRRRARRRAARSRAQRARPANRRCHRDSSRPSSRWALIYIGLRFLRYALDSWSTLILGEQFGMTTTMAAYWSTAFDWIGFAA